jgi:hypothetical protein
LSEAFQALVLYCHLHKPCHWQYKNPQFEKLQPFDLCCRPALPEVDIKSEAMPAAAGISSPSAAAATQDSIGGGAIPPAAPAADSEYEMVCLNLFFFAAQASYLLVGKDKYDTVFHEGILNDAAKLLACSSYAIPI